MSDLEKNGFVLTGKKAIVKTNRMNGSFLREKGYFSFSLLFHCRYQYPIK
ncbi:hypothetical protein I33_1648 [Bacillus subtilis subsp. subtilis str. RO-NN-1]|nr:hypothetical protein I33_1648 [Bacillus subtilis subsp. subtilis str. RO-NN-1]AHA77488.1 Hypothetical Protein U712_07715 [Bacillus subtilis PY79]AKN13603.1 hypothetical protein ABU16_2527 [Bacillus subtilis]ASK23533.1 hypothetical protein BSSX_1638 [Bacillus subtilis]KIN41951.1 hypothetical protein B4070_1532 [Bacillus subtilis]